MKTITLAAAATLMTATAAFAQAEIRAPIVVLPEAAATAPAHVLAGQLDDYDVYGADGKEIGEIEDVVLNMDGSVAAVVLEVGGFLGIGEKDVLVEWDALEITTENNDIRITAPTLTREVLEQAATVDLGKLGFSKD
jgi:sporulation protein YlmC with PRC-barrel domain